MDQQTKVLQTESNGSWGVFELRKISSYYFLRRKRKVDFLRINYFWTAYVMELFKKGIKRKEASSNQSRKFAVIKRHSFASFLLTLLWKEKKAEISNRIKNILSFNSNLFRKNRRKHCVLITFFWSGSTSFFKKTFPTIWKGRSFWNLKL